MIVLLSIALLFFLLVISSLSGSLFLVFALDSMIRGHDLPTSRRATQALVKLIRQYRPDAQNFYDLGCGRGTLSLAIKKALPELPVRGLDKSLIRIFLAKLKAKISGRKIDFRKQDIFEADLGSAQIVYTYLWYDSMPPLEKKLRKELKPGTMVITNTSNLPTWRPIQKIVTYPKVSKPPNFETLFVYIV